MRAISLVKKIEFEYAGNVVRNALTLGDIDNDGCNELIVGNEVGDIAIFKGKERFQTISNLSFISCLAVGDIINQGKNSLVVITAEGWCYVYEVPTKNEKDDDIDSGIDQVDGQIHSSSSTIAVASEAHTQSSGESVISKDKEFTGNSKKNSGKKKIPKNGLVLVHTQRIPANTKSILLGDIDDDGCIEMVLGLTDRVVRSYRWIPNGEVLLEEDEITAKCNPAHQLSGRFVALNKWECANQIGSITLHHSHDGKPSILVAQPGGTFMRIKCQDVPVHLDADESSKSTDTENLLGSIVDYQFLGISRMRNQNISTEILGDFKSPRTAGDSGSSTKNPYAIATLDGTIMLVQDEVILWAIAVDHQIFALTKLDVTGDGADDIVVCSWDGQTYILDQEKNSVRFHLEEPVRAFHSGWYHLDKSEPPVTAMVYVTFKNTIIVYYDIPLKDLVIKKYEPDQSELSELFIDENQSPDQALDYVQSTDKNTKNELMDFLLYS